MILYAQQDAPEQDTSDFCAALFPFVSWASYYYTDAHKEFCQKSDAACNEIYYTHNNINILYICLREIQCRYYCYYIRNAYLYIYININLFNNADRCVKRVS